ncbi:hypothetical protein KQX54_007039 [Cotesia glomerata]|uniref:Uncharacterized protein n=1 Tax=Cotesia glomerata TaxID=32391 RepID=A0AAV7IK01_COTGL|nr:hypothetical protein KQX54_007039 [Cotesia glomerata]
MRSRAKCSATSAPAIVTRVSPASFPEWESIRQRERVLSTQYRLGFGPLPSTHTRQSCEFPARGDLQLSRSRVVDVRRPRVVDSSGGQADPRTSAESTVYSPRVCSALFGQHYHITLRRYNSP